LFSLITFFFSSRRRHTRSKRDWSSDVCSSDLDPQSFLVLPRVLAGTAMFPIIVALAIVTGILTGWIASLALLDLTTPEFIKGLKLFYRFKDTWFGLFKSATFGFTITLVGCVVGLGTRGGAEGVGLSTTRAVVYSAVLLLVLDAFWALVLLR